MDELFVQRRLSEGVNHRLIDGNPVGNAHFRADQIFHLRQRNFFCHVTSSALFPGTYTAGDAKGSTAQIKHHGTGGQEGGIAEIRADRMPAIAGQRERNDLATAIDENRKLDLDARFAVRR